MKSIFFILFFYSVLQLNAQTGINTIDPKATLDVVGQPSSITVMDGIIPPRLTGDQLQAKTYTSDQNGAITFATQASSSPAGQTINVTSAGLYVFNSILNQWIALSSNTANSYSKNVFCDTNDPNTATIFDDELPVVTNTVSLTQNQQNIYYGLDGSVWIWNGTSYISYNQNYNLNVGQRVSIIRTMANSVANNTILPASGLIELDATIRIDLRKVSNTYYSPRILNISANSKKITYQTFATTSNQNEQVVSTTLSSNSALEVDGDNLVDWSTTGTEVITTNVILPDGKWYEIQWFAFEVSSIKQIYMTVLRKF
nr:hypothetical protein [uncultured Flavobacterium sp.]